MFPHIAHRPTSKVLEVEHLTLTDGSVNDVTLYARAGEITGIAGLVGCGKSEVIRAVYGLEPIASGTIRIRGEVVRRRRRPAHSPKAYATSLRIASPKGWRLRGRCARMRRWQRWVGLNSAGTE